MSIHHYWKEIIGKSLNVVLVLLYAKLIAIFIDQFIAQSQTRCSNKYDAKRKQNPICLQQFHSLGTRIRTHVQHVKLNLFSLYPRTVNIALQMLG